MVFNTASGDTHFLNDFAGAILQYLEAGPATLAEILEHIEKSSGEALAPELAAQIQGLIEKFDESGLIEPTGPLEVLKP